jgi:hypothetical protein
MRARLSSDDQRWRENRYDHHQGRARPHLSRVFAAAQRSLTATMPIPLCCSSGADDLDLPTEGQLFAAVSALPPQRVGHPVVLDLSGLRFLGSGIPRLDGRFGADHDRPRGHEIWPGRATALPHLSGRCAPYRVVAGVPNPGTVMVLRVIATTAPRTSATVSTARISTMTTRLWRAGARCAGGRRGHSCGRGAGPRSRRRWRCTPDGSGIVGSRYDLCRSGCRAYPTSDTTWVRPGRLHRLPVRSTGARRSAPPPAPPSPGRGPWGLGALGELGGEALDRSVDCRVRGGGRWLTRKPGSTLRWMAWVPTWPSRRTGTVRAE